MLSSSLPSLPPCQSSISEQKEVTRYSTACPALFQHGTDQGHYSFSNQQHEFRNTPENLLTSSAASLAHLTSRGTDFLCPHSSGIFQAQIPAGTFVVLCFYSLRASDLSSPVHLFKQHFYFFKSTHQRGQAYLFPKWIVKSWK